MSKDDQNTATKDAMESLEEHRINKQMGVNNVPTNAFHDTRIALTSISNEVSDN
jgi:hypothetical protein